MKRILPLLLLAVIAVAACRKKDLPTIDTGSGGGSGTDSTGKVSFRISNVVNGMPLVLDSVKNYPIAGGSDTLYSIATYNYYISNIVLTDDSGHHFAEAESYHLAMASDASSLLFTVPNVPVAHYVSVSFLIGVDSMRNVSGAQTGALDPKYGMFWDWNNGYIMAKLEAYAATSPAIDRFVSYHIAGFGMPNSALRQVNLNFPSEAVVGSTHTPVVQLQSDLDRWFDAPGFQGFATVQSIGSTGSAAAGIANNYAHMFSVTRVDN